MARHVLEWETWSRAVSGTSISKLAPVVAPPN